MNKTRKAIILSAGIIIIAAIIIVGINISYSYQVNCFIKENKFYEAYEYLKENDADGLENINNSGVLFFDVMARHYKKDIIGTGTWMLPDFTGLSCAEIAYALHNIGQAYKIEYIEDERYGANTIAQQIPQCGTEVSKSDTVTLKVNNYTAADNIYNIVKFNYRQFSEIGEWMYYIWNDCIYRSRIDGTENTKIFENSDADRSIVTVLGKANNLYCVLSGKDPMEEIRILWISLDDYSSKEVLQWGLCFDYCTYGDDLYLYAAESYRYNTITGETEKFFKNNQGFILSGDYIYYSEKSHDSILRKDIEGGNEETLVQVPNRISSFCIVDNSIYYIETKQKEDGTYSEHLMQYDMDTKTNKDIILLENETLFCGEHIINRWRDCLVLEKYNGDSIIYDINTRARKYIITPNIAESNLAISELYTVCGNYLCYNITYNVIMKEIYPYRYNLITGEKEEFIVGL